MGRHKGLTADVYRRVAEAGMTMAEAASSLGVTVQSVWVAARKHNITFAAGKRGRKKNAQVVQAQD